MRAAISGVRAPVSLTLRQIYDSSSAISTADTARRQIALSRSAAFLKHEIPNRLKFGMNAIAQNGIDLSKYPFDRIANTFRQTSSEIAAFPDAPSQSESLSWTDVHRTVRLARQMRDKNSEALQNVMRILFNMTEGRTNQERMIDAEFISAVYTGVVGVNLLLSQHLFMWQSPKNTEVPDADIENGLEVKVVSRASIISVVEEAISDAKSLCMEKLGEIPEFHLAEPDSEKWRTPVIFIPSQLHFILVEVLKNAAKASFEHGLAHVSHGQSDSSTISSLHPVTLTLAIAGPFISLKVSDRAGGMEYGTERSCVSWFETATRPKTPTYTYGGDFGPQLSGLGVGLPISRLFCRFMGGDLSLQTLHGFGTDVVFYWNRLGSSSIPVV